MYRNKRDVDKLVESLLSKLSAKEFQSRAYSVAHKYYEVGDYANCQKYVEQYLTHKDNNAAAYKLLGQALLKMGQKEKALEQYKISLEIDPSQTTTIMDICELLADDEVIIDPGRAKYWCEKAEATFPRHPVTFRLRERLMALSNPDPDALHSLLISELTVRPKDALLHARLLNHYINTSKVKEALDHACNKELVDKTFSYNFTWYNILNDLLKHNAHDTKDWLYHLLLLTVKERLCLLSITETPTGTSTSLVESNELLHAYDQAINTVAKLGPAPGFAEFHSRLLQHHKGQIALHAATLLLKKAKKDQISWRDATQFSGPLMLVAWQTIPLDNKVNWLRTAPEKQILAVSRWYSEGTYRCSQAGYLLLTIIGDKNQSFLDQVSQCFSGTHWRDKFYRKIFPSKGHVDKMKSSYLASDAFNPPVYRVPRKTEVEAFDCDAQKEYSNSLHHFIWTLLNYKNYAHFKCTLFDMLNCTASSCGPETLNKLDILAFLYCATLTAKQTKTGETQYMVNNKPNVLPANITDLLCSLSQIKWWDCAYKFSQNELGTELTDIRATLSRGIEVIRCIDNHGLDPELLCMLGRIFSEQAETSANIDEKKQLVERANLYYISAIPLLEKLKSKMVEKVPAKRIFTYTHKEFSTKELITLLEECKLYVSINYLNNGEYEKVIETISNLKSPQAYYQLAQTYKKLAGEENNLSRDDETKSKYAVLLSKSKTFAFKALDMLRENETNKNNALYADVQELIEQVEVHLNKLEPDLLFSVINDGDGKYSSDENVSGVSEHVPFRGHSRVCRNISSTPKASTHKSIADATNYRTAIDSHLLDSTRMDQVHLAKIENEIKNLQKRDSNITDFMEQTKSWFEENRKLGNQIISTIHSNIQSTTDQFKKLTLSVDQVRDQIDECRKDCKDVGDIKKQIADLKNEVEKLKKASTEQTIDESDLYNLEDEYRSNDNSTNFTSRLPFSPSQVLPTFNQRLVPPFSVPPHPYQLYNPNLFNLLPNQYSQFPQSSSVPSAQSMFDPTRTQVNYPSVYPTPDQMYLDVAHLVPPSVSMVPTVPPVAMAPTLPAVSTIPNVTVPPPVTSVTIPKISSDSKGTQRSLPVNVVITSSDPLPTCTTTPAPILSVTIPPKHIKGTPHNYQIPMPSTNDTSVTSPPVFVFPHNKTAATCAGSMSNWASVFKTTPAMSTMQSLLQSPAMTVPKISQDTLDTSRTIIDGMFGISSPNTSLNKSRTLSEKSNTSVENYDPCPDFKPIVPLPAEVKVTTGEEDETVIFSSRAKLFRFVEKQWKERGIGEMKLLKHKATGKVRVLMRREQVHKICANHIITAEMEIKPMKNETKAYFWVANDFADESVVLEKFCIRFKTADIATDFYNAFEKARQESMVSKTSSPVAPKSNDWKVTSPKFGFAQNNTCTKDNSQTSSPGKAVIGGFTFSSTPTFKTVISDVVSEESKPQEVTTSKVNVFSSLSFKTNTVSPFSNIFNTTMVSTLNQSNNTKPTEVLNTSSNKLNTSDTVEEFEPNIDFKPVIPLPALINQKTGEEDETILFEHRAKLLRFDGSSKEWKERGLGNIKLLVHNDNVQKVRLLMRREQIMKVCCNHALTKDMVFQKMPNVDKAVTWCAKDFSEGELVAETFCLRFKTALLCTEFIEAVKSAQTKMKDESKTAKEEQNSAKQTNQTGFADKFKPKPGSWPCDVCYTNNLESFDKCACCETPKPNDTTQVKPVNNTPSNITITAGWGDKFKPKVGSWECQACFVRNDAALENCSACNSPKDPTKARPGSIIPSDNAPKFNFGIPPTSTAAAVIEKVATSSAENIFATNPINKDPNKKSIFDMTGTGTTQFKFGITPTTNEQKPTVESSIFDGTGGHKFSFGIPLNNLNNTQSGGIFGDKPKTVFDTVKPSGDNEPFDFTVKKTNQQSEPVKPALLPTPQSESSASAAFGSKEKSSFDFVFKSKTSTAAKSPVKSQKKTGGDESDGNEYVVEDECQQTFTPVVPLPDKVEVVTGEEHETEIYGHLAKLYRFTSGEWKERGKGIVKILKHKETGKLRIVMRREQIFKICLNHSLTAEINYSQKDEKAWMFAANDFSDGELSLGKFCLRFKNKETALEFKEAVDKALKDLTVVTNKGAKISEVAKDENDDVIFISETQATKEEKQMAKELMLPENFFTYKNKEPCEGCRGCQDERDSNATSTKTDESLPTSESKSVKSTAASVIFKGPPITSNIGTPLKDSSPLFQSPTTSVYGTPTNLEKTVDTSIFRTPLGSLGSNSKTTMPITSQSIFGNGATNKENAFAQKSNLFTAFKQEQSSTEPSQNSAASVFGNSDPSVGSKSFFLAPPKLSANNNADENQKDSVPNSFNFGSAQPLQKSTFGSALGVSSNKSIFDFSKDTKADSQNTEVKSIFGGENKTENLFTSLNQSSIFGPGALANSESKLSGNIFGSSGKSLFGSVPPQNSVFGNEKSIFSVSNQPVTVDQKQEAVSTVVAKKPDEKDDNKDKKKVETLFSVDNSLSFAALSSSSSGGFSTQKVADFRWEGAGQQLFGVKKGMGQEGDKSNNESGAGDEAGGAGADEEYDPHYEPIVPLPDKIVVTTGEEDEEKCFGERCKLYRYDEKNREWKERGIGEIKVLYHPERKTYRFLLRREQVHKAVLNMLMHADLELLPMKNSDRAWTWAGRNFAENPSGEQETLAVRFKNVALATFFQEKVTECVRKLQAAAAAAIREEKESTEVAPLRLPKHLQESARADDAISAKGIQHTANVSATVPTTCANNTSQTAASDNVDSESIQEMFKQPDFQASSDHEQEDDDNEYDDDEDYDGYEDENAAYYTCEGEAIILQGDIETTCSQAYIQVSFDQEIYSPKILVTDPSTGEILADMLIHTETEFQVKDNTCIWSGMDYTSNDPVDKTVTINFHNSETAMQFYDSCETSKAATYSLLEQES